MLAGAAVFFAPSALASVQVDAGFVAVHEMDDYGANCPWPAAETACYGSYEQGDPRDFGDDDVAFESGHAVEAEVRPGQVPVAGSLLDGAVPTVHERFEDEEGVEHPLPAWIQQVLDRAGPLPTEGIVRVELGDDGFQVVLLDFPPLGQGWPTWLPPHWPLRDMAENSSDQVPRFVMDRACHDYQTEAIDEATDPVCEDLQEADFEGTWRDALPELRTGYDLLYLDFTIR
jgi:hypothetical protein